MQYHDSEDLKRLVEFKQLAPTEFSAFIEFERQWHTNGRLRNLNLLSW